MTVFAPIERPASIDAVRAVLADCGLDLPLSAPQFGQVRIETPADLTVDVDGEALPVDPDAIRWTLADQGFAVDDAAFAGGDLDAITVLCARELILPTAMVPGQTRVMWTGRPTLVTRVELLDGGSAEVHLVNGTGVRCRASEGFTVAVAVEEGQ